MRGGGGTLKAYENVQGEGGHMLHMPSVHMLQKIANSVGDFSPHISMITQVSNLLISCLASSTHLSAGFKSMTCK